MAPLDESVLADFLAGRLSPARRAEVVQLLAQSASARERLCLAHACLEAAEAPASVPARPAPARVRLPVPSRPAAPRRHTRRVLARVAAAGALLVGTLAVLRIASPGTDPVRTAETAPAALAVDVAPTSLAIAWNAVPVADRYEVMVWDEGAAREVATEQAAGTRLDGDGAFARLLRTRLEPGRRYAVRVVAYDAEGRQLAASPLTSFRYGR